MNTLSSNFLVGVLYIGEETVQQIIAELKALIATVYLLLRCEH